MLHSLTAIFALLGLVVAVWLLVQEQLLNMKRHRRRLVFGAAMGLGAVAELVITTEIAPGSFFDLHTTCVAIAAFIGGPLAAVVAGALALSYSVASENDRALGLAFGIALAAAVGLAVHQLAGKRTPSGLHIFVFSLGAALASSVNMAIHPASFSHSPDLNSAIVATILSFIANFGASIAIGAARKRNEEQRLVLGVLSQAPDYLYVKDRHSRFMVVNEMVAKINGINSPKEMRGLTDFDITSPDRAKQLFDREQWAMATGHSLMNIEDRVEDELLGDRWFVSSKAVVRDGDGEVLGLAGITRDVTENTRQKMEAEEARNQLQSVLAEVADGIARFDSQGTLVYCNRRYSELFTRTAHVRRSGQHIRDILAAVCETREQRGIPDGDTEGWVDAIAATLKTGHQQEIQLFDGRWLLVRTRPNEDGSALVVASDITANKESEHGLIELTQQLKRLASTDGLTGLLNRRSFDDSLQNELARSRRNGQPIGLIMIDIDRFKAFNDTYGHPAGDECIRKVAGVLRAVAKRPADVVARYGGEELCMILPETDEPGTYAIAEELRLKVRGLGIMHNASEKGVVTISLGIATYSGGEPTLSTGELISRADEALYTSKGAGRDRTMGWSQRVESRILTA